MDAYRGTNDTKLSIEQVEWATKKYSSHRRIPDIDLVPQEYEAATMTVDRQPRIAPGVEDNRQRAADALAESDSGSETETSN